MTWVRSQMGKTSYLVPLVVMLVLIGMLALNGSRPMAKIKNDGNLPQAVDLDPHPGIFETALVAMEAQVDLGNGVTATAMTFNGIVPGPEIRLKVGDKVIVHFTNNLPIPSSIHWHGIELTNRSDGTGITQDAVPPGGTFTYDFIVPRAGIFFYHSHIMPTNPSFKGYYGSLIVEDPVEKKLLAHKIIPRPENTLTLVLGDTTVCKEPGFNDTDTFPPDLTGTVPWAGVGLFPGKTAQPSPQKLCEEPLDEHGHFLLPHPGTVLPAGAIPNVQPTNDCGSVGEPGCPTNEGQLVLVNGKIPAARAGSPGAPGAVAPNAEFIDVNAGEGIRLQVASAATIRYFRLRLTDQTGNQITLFRIGGQGGILDSVRMEGGTQGTLDTQYDPGEILLPVASREDIAFVPVGVKGDVLTLWTLDYKRTGGGQGNMGFSALPTVPIAHFRIVKDNGKSKNDRFEIAAGDPLRIHPKAKNEPVETLKAATITEFLLDPLGLTPPEIGTDALPITLTATGQPAIDLVDGFLFDEGATPPALFTSVPHIGSSRYAAVGSLQELTIKNDTFAHHPWHPHGFSIQAVRFVDNATATTLFELPYNEFVDVVDIPPGTTLVYRVRLDDRPFDFDTPTGGAIGRWAMHCHIFFHAAIGMITELVALVP
jgi:FtsP/CotA-like multicopper oxidase with cupredoxin domain